MAMTYEKQYTVWAFEKYKGCNCTTWPLGVAVAQCLKTATASIFAAVS